jgi:hypothetical protein
MAGEARAQWGDLSGQILFDGKAPAPAPLDVNKDQAVCADPSKPKLVDESLLVGADGGLANVVVYVRTRGVKVHPDVLAAAQASTPVMDNLARRFEPHVLPFLVSRPVTLKNSDAVGHNTNAAPLGDTAYNPLIPPGGTFEAKFNRAQTLGVPVACNVHPWMKGYILPRDNPYFAVTGADGKFEIKNLPVGAVELQLWHETLGYVDTTATPKGRVTVTIKAGANTLPTVKGKKK